MLQADPGMDGKVSVLKEMMAPEWGPSLDAYGAANAFASGDVSGSVARLLAAHQEASAPPVGGADASSGWVAQVTSLLPLAGGAMANASLESSHSVISEDWGNDIGSGGPADELGSLGVTPDLALAAIAKSLPPEGKKAVAAAQAMMKGDPIGAVMAVLPPEAQEAASIALPLAMGDLDGSLMALAGKFMPPELQGVLSAFMNMGGLSGVLGIKLPKLPSPFVKPDADPPPNADLSMEADGGGASAPMAARISDLRSCPKGAGPIITGQMNVLVGFMPAARIGDAGLCIGPPDLIEGGAPRVRIGGSMASRVGDSTAHGGTIKTGFSTVLIGGAEVVCIPCMLAAAARRSAFVIGGPSGID